MEVDSLDVLYRVVFRKGSPMVIQDLMMVSAYTARSIILLADAANADRADADTLRSVLALKSIKYGLVGHVVAEVRDVDNEPLVKIVGGEEVETVVSHDIMGRLMLMSARQPGLAKVYSEVLGFDGDEFYVKEWPEIHGVPFGECAERFPDAVPIGIKSEDGTICLKPHFNRRLKPGDELIVIAEDDDSYEVVETFKPILVGEVPVESIPPKEKEKILFCGWRRDIRDILRHVDQLVAKVRLVGLLTVAFFSNPRCMRCV